ncbi:MAG: sensor histidine kinase [Bacteroidetes bacterium]|nr:MAG: sensor histidine kinase [Bacteroidota bacterium]
MDHPPLPASWSERVLAALDYAVLEPRPDGTFRLCGRMPDWLRAFLPGSGEAAGPLDLAAASLFLEHFLVDARAFWASGAPGPLGSGPWTETDRRGREWVLEATALSVDGRALLLVGFPQMDFHRTQQLVQAARVQVVQYHRTLEEIARRDVLLHCIVHDLKNPLAGLKGSLDMLRAGLLGEEPLQEPAALELVEIGLRQAGKMQALIQTIQEAFAGEIDGLVPSAQSPEQAPDAAAVVRDVVAGLLPEARLKALTVDTRLPPGPVRVVGDAARLERMLYNLLTNALRFAPAGSTVTVGVRGEAEAATLYVEDEGPGVPPEQQPRLFRKFARGNDQPGHVGLGLYFCRITAESWGGRIGYEDRPGGGARFWVRLPRPTPR